MSKVGISLNKNSRGLRVQPEVAKNVKSNFDYYKQSTGVANRPGLAGVKQITSKASSKVVNEERSPMTLSKSARELK